MKITVAHPTGNQFSVQLADYLQSQERLSEYWTGLYWSPDWLVNRMIPRSLKKSLNRRSLPKALQAQTRTFPYRELGRLLSGQTGCKGLYQKETAAFSVDTVFRCFDLHFANKLDPSITSVIYAYEDGALSLFQKAKSLGIKRAYDLPIAYWKVLHRLIHTQLENYPDWALTMRGLSDSPSKLQRKSEEIELADTVVVPSSFVANSLPDSIRAKKEVIISPFGTPSTSERSGVERDSSLPLKVLFVGSMSQRKGLADLFAAYQMLQTSQVELHVLGTPQIPIHQYKERCPKMIHHTPRPHREVLQLMRACHVLVLPSIVEGRALVMQEAMSQGLPLIITPNTGGEDLIDEGETGFLVPINSPESIAEKIEWLLAHFSLLNGMSEKARGKVRPLTWERYGHTIMSGLS